PPGRPRCRGSYRACQSRYQHRAIRESGYPHHQGELRRRAVHRGAFDLFGAGNAHPQAHCVPYPQELSRALTLPPFPAGTPFLHRQYAAHRGRGGLYAQARALRGAGGQVVPGGVYQEPAQPMSI
nr:hypothetical protein [Tanacetum cinerariifolium]